MGKRDNKPWEPTPKHKIKLDKLKRPIEEHRPAKAKVHFDEYNPWNDDAIKKLVKAQWDAPGLTITFTPGNSTTKPELKPDPVEDWAEKWVKENG